MTEYLNSKVIFPVVRQRLVELAILFFWYVVGVSCPDWFRLVQFFILIRKKTSNIFD